MTDREKLEELLRSWGLNPTIIPVDYLCRGEVAAPGTVAVHLGAGWGYTGLYVDFYFDAAGKFIEHGVWE